MGLKIETICPYCNAKRNKVIQDTCVDKAGQYKIYNKIVGDTLFDVKCPCCNTKYYEPYSSVYVSEEFKVIIGIGDISTSV